MLFFSEKGILKLSLFMGLTEKTLRLGDNLSDDKWHTVKYERRGMVMSLGIDHHRPVIGKYYLIQGVLTEVGGGSVQLTSSLRLKR